MEPGRKTDVADALWLAELLAHGLILPSFVPETPTQEMRALLRTRKQLVRERASHVQRIRKTLEDANLKLGSVLTQIMGVSGRAILQALIEANAIPTSCSPCCSAASRRHPRSCAPPCKGASPRGIASCCVCIYARSMRSMSLSPRSMPRCTAISALFAKQSNCCGASPASAT